MPAERPPQPGRVEISSVLDGTGPAAVGPPPVAQVFGALAEPLRLSILRELRQRPLCVCELEPELGAAQSLLSYHLKVLRDAGLIEAARLGRRTEYRIRPAALRRLAAAIEALAPGYRADQLPDAQPPPRESPPPVTTRTRGDADPPEDRHTSRPGWGPAGLRSCPAKPGHQFQQA